MSRHPPTEGWHTFREAQPQGSGWHWVDWAVQDWGPSLVILRRHGDHEKFQPGPVGENATTPIPWSYSYGPSDAMSYLGIDENDPWDMKWAPTTMEEVWGDGEE